KAKAGHVRVAKREELVSRSRVAEWEEPRHPGTASQLQSTPQRPTLQHRTRFSSHLVVARTPSLHKKSLFPGLLLVGRFVPSAWGARRTACRTGICTRDCRFRASRALVVGRGGRNPRARGEWPRGRR